MWRKREIQKIMTKNEALQKALDALGPTPPDCCGCQTEWQIAIDVIKKALAQPDQEPVAWLHKFIEGGISIGLKPSDLKRHPERWEPLYTTPPQQELVCVCGAVWEGQELVETPPQRTWVGLTDEEIDDLSRTMVKGNKSVNWLCQSIEAKLKDKNL
jgi:hypothetical protein